MLLTCVSACACCCVSACARRCRGSHACSVRVERALLCVCSCARRRAASVREACEAKAGQARCGGDLFRPCARWSAFCTAKVKSKVTRQLKALLRRVSRRGGRRTLCSLARCSTAHATVCAHAAARGQCARRKPSISLALSGTELQLRTSKTTCQPTSKKTMTVQPPIRGNKS